ncbi:MAG: hypothetical protein RLZZ574_308 [Cyanobacteriota bacterium]
MGLLIRGVWYEDSQIRASKDGSWKRSASILRNWITRDGANGFKAEVGRYHLYAAWNCPWAHRALIFRKLKQLEDIVSVSYVLPRRNSQGWVFEPGSEFQDDLFKYTALHQIYTRGYSKYTGRVTVPVLWDRQTKTIVSNESADIIRMFNRAFVDIAPKTPDYVPEFLKSEIDTWNQRIYSAVNNGVYKAGFATTQEAYEKAVYPLFATFDAIEEQLSKSCYLIGDQPLEADWRLFPTLVRFDVAYYGAFKCNLKKLIDYPNLWSYTRRLYLFSGISETVKLDIYRKGYYAPSQLRNPFGILPIIPSYILYAQNS